MECYSFVFPEWAIWAFIVLGSVSVVYNLLAIRLKWKQYKAMDHHGGQRG